MDQDEVIRRSIARLSFKWKNAENPDRKEARTVIDMVIPGVIVSVKDGKCLIIVDPSFFRDKPNISFYVTLPEEGGKYGKRIYFTRRTSNCIVHEEFYGIVVKSNNYIAAVSFDTSPLEQSDHVFSFQFAREVAVSEAYCPGHIVASIHSQSDVGVLFHDCALHEYGHFGSPIFNHKGLAVGICYATQGRTHAWTVDFLKYHFDKLFKNWSVTYVSSNEHASLEGGSSSHELPTQQPVPNPSATSASSDASNRPPPTRSCLGLDMDLGNVPHLMAKRPRIGVSGSSPLHRAPAHLPSGVVTLGYTMDESSQMIYFTGIIILCERGQGNEHTTFVLSSYKTQFDQVYVCFDPNRRTKAEFCSSNPRFMIVSIKDEQFHEPISWSSKTDPFYGYQFVNSISIMAGTKLNLKAAAPLYLIGVLGLYAGQIITPRCHAATTSSCEILSGTEKYFQFSCPFQDDLVNFRNIDLDKVSYECDSMVIAPVFSLKGEFVGIVNSSGNWPDTKTGMYSQWLLPIVEHLMKVFYKGWSKDKLKWSSAQTV